ncbi:protein LONGIFOLIA 1-like [Abrus precatorius]|uniref:Protein LONGIFOLIA 1-like n=1 Tax=Abrus precatorius TaxID=3816 RepID=A0A8B8LQY6_ABRPR|nr:protein LONGIFOLIA 1-like [Abrus precatorius]
MSKKVLTSMKDENPDLQKQIGCISGFFQLFDRQRFLTGQRGSSHSQNTPTQGRTSNHTKELNNTTQKATAKNVKVARENQQFSTESSGTSVSSSSRSSSMSSLEFNRTVQIEPSSMSQIKVQENSDSGTTMKQLSNQGHQPLDFYDIVKDSMHRDVHRLSVKTIAKEEKKGRILKYIDSPRPLEAAKSINTGVKVAWESPRLSYDGRDMHDTSKSGTKHKEFPRLSLDSKQGSIKSFNEGTKPHNLLKGPHKGYVNSNTMPKQLQESETSKRPSSVVAKLMGLEAFPDCTQTCDTPPGISSCTTNKIETFAGSSMIDEHKQHQSLASPRTSKGSILLQSRRDASILNVMPCSQFSLESSPWRQPEARQGSQLQASKRSESSITASNTPLSVYGEIEKRVANLEFKNSGKDLRALKQILDAMQRYKESLDITRDRASNSPSDNRSNSSLSESSIVQSPRIQQKDTTFTPIEMSNPTHGNKSPIFIMKPAKDARKTNNPASTEMPFHDKSDTSKSSPGKCTNGILVDNFDRQTTKGINSAIRHVKDPTSQHFNSVDKSTKMKTSKMVQSSKVPQVINGENATISSNTAETRSPRLQKKFGLERRSSPTNSSSDSSSNRRQHNKQPGEMSSPSTKTKQKFSTLQERNEHFSEINYQRRDFKHEVDVVSSDFDSKRSMDSYSDVEVIHIDHSQKINSYSIQLKGLNQNNAAKELSKESFMAEKISTAEQPSPVSVLDAAFYREEPPSPVKKKSYISKDLDEALNTYDSSEENSDDLPLSANTAKANFSNGNSDTNLKTENLVQILGQIDYNDKRFTNFNEDKDPDHKYISEILLVSGLLNSPRSSQAFHSSGYPINPKLFLALEQIKTNKMCFNIDHSAMNIAWMDNPEQKQRKLIFDVVNDILAQKIISESSTSTLWFQPNQLAGKKLRGQQLLDELCTEIDQLQQKSSSVSHANEDENSTNLVWEELMHCPTIYTNSYNAIPNIVLDIERLIFKDLITEVVRGELANHSGKRCRQLLFPN